MKKLTSIMLALAMLLALLVPAMASAAPAGKPVYLGGNGSEFNKTGWQNVFYLGGAESHKDPNVWHLVIAPPKAAASVTKMQLTFSNYVKFEWTPSMGFSTNAGNNNPGWVIVAPADWQLVHNNKKQSLSFLLSTGGVNNFNISGFHRGTAEPYGALNVKANVVEEYWKAHHKPVYKMYNYGTLVSWGNTLGGAPLPEGITGDLFLNNGMTYLKINKAALESWGETGVTIGIAESNKPGGGAPNAAWNSPVAGDKNYNLKIADGKLIVTSNLPGFGAAVYDTDTVKGPADIQHNDQTVYEIKTDKNGDFWFFFHIERASYHLGEIIDCTPDYEDGPFSRLFRGEVTMTVTAANDIEVYHGPLGKVDHLLAGNYTVALNVNGIWLTSQSVTVVASKTIDVDFGTQTVPGDKIVEIDCPRSSLPH